MTLETLLLGDGERLVAVKCWWPSWGEYGLEWPTMLVEDKGGGRSTRTPCWTREMFTETWRRFWRARAA